MFVRYRYYESLTVYDQMRLAPQVFLQDAQISLYNIEQNLSVTQQTLSGQQVLNQMVSQIYELTKVSQINEFTLTLIDYHLRNFPIVLRDVYEKLLQIPISISDTPMQITFLAVILSISVLTVLAVVPFNVSIV